jgi:hypothetical protein
MDRTNVCIVLQSITAADVVAAADDDDEYTSGGGRTCTQKSEWTRPGLSAYSTNSQPNCNPEWTRYPLLLK